MWWEPVIGLVVGVVVLWLVLLVVLWRIGPGEARLREALRLLPDVLRLVARLARDSSLPPGVRLRLWLLTTYLALPIDVVPDFIPGLGYADDALLVIWTLRSVTRRAGPDALERHWPGSAEGLRVMTGLVGRT